jgi:antitoxin VapB
MALSIKNREVERLAEELAQVMGESKTEAIRRALEERRQRMTSRVVPARRRDLVMRTIEREIWGTVPPELLDLPRDRAFEDRVLGYEEEETP